MSNAKGVPKFRYGDLVNAAKAIDRLRMRVKTHKKVQIFEFEDDEREYITASLQLPFTRLPSIAVEPLKKAINKALVEISDALELEHIGESQEVWVSTKVHGAVNDYESIAGYVQALQGVLNVADKPKDLATRIVEHPAVQKVAKRYALL
jgi:hypothetical protein